MKRSNRKGNGQTADRLLCRLAMAVNSSRPSRRRLAGFDSKVIAELAAADLIAQTPDGTLAITDAVRARLARWEADKGRGAIDPFRRQHMTLARRAAERHGNKPTEAAPLLVNDAESPLAWLARRKGRDGRPIIEPIQFQAGERLRADFTFAQLTPRMTVNWASPISGADGAARGQPPALAETVLAAKQRFNHALDAVGPEFAGLLVDICCFLKGIEDAEREREWPPRSAKVVLQLGLDRLARHYGLGAEARGRGRAALRAWLALGECFVVEAEAGSR